MSYKKRNKTNSQQAVDIFIFFFAFAAITSFLSFAFSSDNPNQPPSITVHAAHEVRTP